MIPSTALSACSTSHGTGCLTRCLMRASITGSIFLDFLRGFAIIMHSLLGVVAAPARDEGTGARPWSGASLQQPGRGGVVPARISVVAV